MTIHTDDETDDRDHVAELIEAAERATPEDTSHDAGPLDLEALANSEAVQAIIDLRLAQERERNAEELRRFVAWVIVGSLTLGFGLGLGLAQIVAWVAS